MNNKLASERSMLSKFSFKSLGIAILIYLIGIYVFPVILAALFYVILELTGNELPFDSLRNDYFEYILELLLSGFIMIVVGYYANKIARNTKLDHSLIVGFILFGYNLIQSIIDMFNPKGDPFLINLIYDISLIIFSYLGGRIAKKRKPRIP